MKVKKEFMVVCRPFLYFLAPRLSANEILIKVYVASSHTPTCNNKRELPAASVF